jgi:hypothetical protein
LLGFIVKLLLSVNRYLHRFVTGGGGLTYYCYAPSFENRKVHPEIVLPEHSVVLLSDRNMLERIFQNLLTNVIRYSTGETKISLSLTEKGGIIFKTENRVQNEGELDTERMFE